MQLILSHHLSLTLLGPLPQHVEIGIYRHMWIRIQTCSSDTREDAQSYMTFFFFSKKKNSIGKESDFFC